MYNKILTLLEVPEKSWPENSDSFCDLKPTKRTPGNSGWASTTKNMTTRNYCHVNFIAQTDPTKPCCLRCISFFCCHISLFLQMCSIISTNDLKMSQSVASRYKIQHTILKDTFIALKKILPKMTLTADLAQRFMHAVVVCCLWAI